MNTEGLVGIVGRRWTCLAATMVVMMAFPETTAGQETDVELRYERFQLFTNCSPIRLAVGVNGDALDGLSEDALVRAARSRLRSARLYDEISPYLLEVYVHVVGVAFHVEVAFVKRVSDLITLEVFGAETWNRSVTGTHGRDSGYVLSSISPKLDEFLDEYLKVNEEACSVGARDHRKARFVPAPASGSR